MYECYHFIADAFDAVLALAAVVKSRTLARLQHNCLAIAPDGFDLIARRQRARAARRADKGGDAPVAVDACRLHSRVTGHVAVKAIVGQQLELGQHHIFIGLADVLAVGALQSQNHIRLRAGGQVQLAAIFADAFVALDAHIVGHNHHRLVALQLTDVGRANAEIACAGTDHPLVAWAQIVQHLGLGQGGVGRADFHRSAGEVAPTKNDNIGFHAGQFRGQDQMFHFAVRIFPVDIE